METSQNFTSLLYEKLGLLEFPEIIQEIIINDLAEIIIKRIYTDIAMSQSGDIAKHLSSLVEAGDFNALYESLTVNNEYEEKALSIADSVLEDFKTQLTGEL
jgi:hypothetical protein